MEQWTRAGVCLAVLLALSFLQSLFLLQVFAGLIVVLWVAGAKGGNRIHPDAVVLSFIVFGVVRLISAAFSEYPGSSSEAYHKDALFHLGLLAFIPLFRLLGGRQNALVLISIVVGGLLASAVALVRFGTGDVHRAQTYSSGFSAYSSYLLVVLPYLLWLGDDIFGKRGRFVCVGGLAIVLAGLVTSLGRFNIAVGTLVLVVYAATHLRRAGDLLIACALSALLSWGLFSLNPGELTERVGDITNLSDRDLLYAGAAELAWDHPLLGYGPRTFHDIFPYADRVQDKGIGSWHNDYVQVYMESGLAGLAALLMFLVCLGRHLLARYRGNAGGAGRRVAAAAGVALGALLLSAITAGFVNSPTLSVVFAFIVGTSYADQHSSG